ncbi:hypothetical protein B296_00059109 [Ensete ventricosum]|uniref:Uncharacterized protein n=1 Tax=Ensete ventricosum TaxID=4639 RepID=A0A426XJ05_ENSVE|nr:hypothetical protein B296_00059109 [Ensete ventricosum]
MECADSNGVTEEIRLERGAHSDRYRDHVDAVIDGSKDMNFWCIDWRRTDTSGVWFEIAETEREVRTRKRSCKRSAAMADDRIKVAQAGEGCICRLVC